MRGAYGARPAERKAGRVGKEDGRAGGLQHKVQPAAGRSRAGQALDYVLTRLRLCVQKTSLRAFLPS